MIAPVPEKIEGYPWLLKIWPYTIVALGPVWFYAVLTGNRTLAAIIAPWFVGFALGKAFWEILSMRREERRWREADEEYRALWLRRHGS